VVLFHSFFEPTIAEGTLTSRQGPRGLAAPQRVHRLVFALDLRAGLRQFHSLHGPARRRRLRDDTGEQCSLELRCPWQTTKGSSFLVSVEESLGRAQPC